MDGKEILAIAAIMVLVSVWYSSQTPSTTAPTTTTTAMITTTTIAAPATTTTTVATTTTTTTVAQSGFAILSAEATPNPVKTNKYVNFTAKVSDPKSDSVQVLFCKEPTCSFRFCSKTDYASPSGAMISCDSPLTVVMIGNNSFWVLGKKAGAQTSLYGPVGFTVIHS